MQAKKPKAQITLTIHRAANEIGGNCVELADCTTRILFDFGLPLSSIKEQKPARAYRIPLKGIYKEDPPQIKAVFLTHAHPDHSGLLSEIHPQIPVYASQTTVNLLKNVAPLFGNHFEHVRFVPLQAGKSVKIGTLHVKPMPVDHSAAESFAYEITAGGKRILYTGDLRAHGNCAFLTRRFAHRKNQPDYLLLEGTTLSRPKGKAETEKALQARLQTTLSADDTLPLIYFSAQNLDRFISVYKAARKLKKTLIVDPYTCFVLEQFSHLKKVPQWNWANIRVYFTKNSLTHRLKDHLSTYTVKKITLREILFHPQDFIIKDNFALRRQLLKHTKKLRLIHSAWQGYLEEPDNAFIQDSRDYRLPLIVLHTSGHADIKMLQSLVHTLHPKTLIPIHTSHAQDYAQLFGVPVRVLSNGKNIPL